MPENLPVAVSDANEPVVVDAEFLPFDQLTLWEPAAVVRPEYNIGKFAGVIFASPYAKNLNEARRQDWKVTQGDVTANASLEIRPLLGHITPTTTTLRVYLALIQIWYLEGKPESGVIHFSARQLAKIIGWKWSGTATANRIRDHIKILKGTGLTWVFSFTHHSGFVEEKNSDMSILSSAEYFERRDLVQSDKYKGLHRVRFNPDLIENMINGLVRPINYVALTKIANDITLTLYTKLDLYLSSRPKWERRSKELFEQELGMTAERYTHRRIRLQKLKEFVTSLNGAELMEGTLRVAIEWTRDKEDHKLVAWKEADGRKRKKDKPPAIVTVEEAEMLASDLMTELSKYPNGTGTNEGFLIYLCRHYPQELIQRALSIAKADYGNYDKAIGAVFVYELEQIIENRKDLIWYTPKEGSRR
ncbi:MAG: hypothetical protein WBD51_11905 [Burkholderiaceae bacterium]